MTREEILQKIEDTKNSLKGWSNALSNATEEWDINHIIEMSDKEVKNLEELKSMLK